MGEMARMAAAAERTPSRWPSIAEGEGWGDVKPVTVQFGGSVCSRERRQAAVMEGVLFGFMRRMLICLVEVPVMDGSGEAMLEVMELGWEELELCVRSLNTTAFGRECTREIERRGTFVQEVTK